MSIQRRDHEIIDLPNDPYLYFSLDFARRVTHASSCRFEIGEESKLKKQSMLRLTATVLVSVGVVAAVTAQTSAKADSLHATSDCEQVVASILAGLSDLVTTSEQCFGPLTFCTVFFGS